jgi:hypothetical protein
MRRRILCLAALAGVPAVVACTSQQSFPDAAKSFIQDDDGELAQVTGRTYEDATCTDPANTDVGAEFTCTAVGSDGVTYNFVGRITGRQTFEVGEGSPPVAPPTGSSVPGTAASGTAASGTAPPGTAAPTTTPAAGG